MPPCAVAAPVIAEPLIQIRRGYSTTCCYHDLSVESDAGGWAVRVREPRGGRVLYSARRCSLASAKIAATEFAVLFTTGAGGRTPEAMAQYLTWREYW